MNALTAGIALTLVQLCTALVMAGVYYVSPSEKYTRQWAVGAFLTALGVSMVVLNAGKLNYPVLLTGNSLLFLGLIFQWWGVQTFYEQPRKITGYVFFAAFVLGFSLLLFNGVPVDQRAALSGVSIVLVSALLFNDVRKHGLNPPTFGSVLALLALGLLMVSTVARTAGNLARLAEFRPVSSATIGVFSTYLLPMVSGLLISASLILLYFEKTVRAKEHLADHDALTRLLNRRATVLRGEHEIELGMRQSYPIAIGFIDVDFFKRINDEFGHAAGDAVLAEVAQVLHSACRTVDLIGRYGGEEFCAVFPGIGEDGINVLGNRLLEAVRLHRFDMAGAVTISIGFAIQRPDGTPRSWDQLVREADRQLYRAKHLGRDRFCVGVTEAAQAPASA